jgi:hypothetical protein
VAHAPNRVTEVPLCHDRECHRPGDLGRSTAPDLCYDEDGDPAILTVKVSDPPMIRRYFPGGAGLAPEKPIVRGQVPVASTRRPEGS